jgi:hypothetical protein
MTLTPRFVTMIVSLTLSGLAWLSSPLPAQAAPITDTFQLKETAKEWCEDNPKFVEADNVPVTESNTVTFTRDPLNTGDLTMMQTTLNTQGASAEIDVITLTGLVFPSTEAGRTAQFLLFGTNPSLPDHFLSIRGQATFDTLGNLTKVTGTVVGLTTDTYTIDKKTGAQSGPVECFVKGTLGTGTRL